MRIQPRNFTTKGRPRGGLRWRTALAVLVVVLAVIAVIGVVVRVHVVRKLCAIGLLVVVLRILVVFLVVVHCTTNLLSQPHSG